MKTIRPLPLTVVAALAAVFASPLLMAVPTEIARESFEGAGGAIGFTTSVPQFDEPSVATSDFFSVILNNGTKLIGGTLTGGDGASIFAAEDIDTAPTSLAPTQSITFNPVNITGKTSTSVKILLAAPGTGPAGGGTQNFYDWSATAADIDLMRVEASVDGGPFIRLVQFAPSTATLNQPLSLDTDGNGLGGEGTTLTAAFQTRQSARCRWWTPSPHRTCHSPKALKRTGAAPVTRSTDALPTATPCSTAASPPALPISTAPSPS